MLDTSKLKLLRFDPTDRCKINMGRKPTDATTEILTEGVGRDGQLSPGIVARIPAAWYDLSHRERVETFKPYMIDPADFGSHITHGIICGNRRDRACCRAGVPFSAFELEEFPTAEQFLRWNWQENANRRDADAFEACAIIMATVAALPPKSPWRLVAKVIGEPEATVLLHAEPRHIPEDLRPLMAGLDLTVVRNIGKVRPVSRMKEVVEFAHGDGQTPVTLAMVKNFIKGKNKSVGRKPSKVETKINGRYMRFDVKPGESPEQVVADLKEIIRRLNSYNGDATGIGYILPRA